MVAWARGCWYRDYQTEGVPECSEDELLMLVGGWGLLRIVV